MAEPFELDARVRLDERVSRAIKTEIVTTLKRQATRVLADVRKTEEPVLITEHGKPSAYLVDAASFDLMRARKPGGA